MKSKILLSVMVIALAAAMIGGGIMAGFTDEEVSEGSGLDAGTLMLDVQGEEEAVETYTFENIEPGDSDTVSWTVKNTGSLDGLLTVSTGNIKDEYWDGELKDDDGNLDADNLVLVEAERPWSTEYKNPLLSGALYMDGNVGGNQGWGHLGRPEDYSGDHDEIELNAGEEITVTYRLDFTSCRSSAEATRYDSSGEEYTVEGCNAYQGARTQFDVTFTLEQQE